MIRGALLSDPLGKPLPLRAPHHGQRGLPGGFGEKVFEADAEHQRDPQ